MGLGCWEIIRDMKIKWLQIIRTRFNNVPHLRIKETLCSFKIVWSRSILSNKNNPFNSYLNDFRYYILGRKVSLPSQKSFMVSQRNIMIFYRGFNIRTDSIISSLRIFTLTSKCWGHACLMNPPQHWQ